MKAKEAPENLYITYKGYGVFDEDSAVERTKDSQTEYTSTDAFIEKAVEWIKEKWDDNYTMPIIIDSVINDFVNYMKGENE